MTKPTAVLFDLDGTLTDPQSGITRCIQHALVSLGCVAPASDKLRWCIGPSLHQSFAQLIKEPNRRAAPPRLCSGHANSSNVPPSVTALDVAMALASTLSRQYPRPYEEVSCQPCFGNKLSLDRIVETWVLTVRVSRALVHGQTDSNM